VNALVPIPVALPVLGAGLALALVRRPSAQRVVTVVVLVAMLGVSLGLLLATSNGHPLAVWVGGWQPPLGISLVSDRVSSLMLVVSAAVALAVLIYSIGQNMVDDDEDAPVSIYHPTFLILVAGVANAFLTGDLFNLFVSFEMLLFASYVLLTLGGTEGRIQAGTIYVVVNMLSSALFLISISMIYAATGTVNMAQLSQRLAELPDSTALLLQVMLLTTFGIKAAIFPLCFWLPDSYPTAPAPVTAVFAGLLTKVGVYAILRTQTLLFPDSPLTTPLLWVAALTMLFGILGAIAQSDLKRMLSFTLVSHIGFLIFGIALMTPAGLSSAVFYIAHHITIQTVLFLVLGLLERVTGTTSLSRLGGMAKLFPLIAVLFFVPAMNLAGIPPFSGFLGKIGLISAGLDHGSSAAYMVVGASVVTSLLTLYVISRCWALAFWRTPSQAQEMAVALVTAAQSDRQYRRLETVPVTTRAIDTQALQVARERITELEESGSSKVGVLQRELERRADRPFPGTMVGATLALLALSVLISVIAGPMYAYTDHAALDLLDPGVYISAVFGGSAP